MRIYSRYYREYAKKLFKYYFDIRYTVLLNFDISGKKICAAENKSSRIPDQSRSTIYISRVLQFSLSTELGQIELDELYKKLHALVRIESNFEEGICNTIQNNSK